MINGPGACAPGSPNLQRRSEMKNLIEWLASLTGLLTFGALLAIVILIGMAA